MIKVIEILCGLICILSVHAIPMPKKYYSVYRTDSNKYYIPPSETPYFTRLDDYPGQNIDLKWTTGSFNVHVDQEQNNDIQLTWKKGDTAVQLNKKANNDVQQQWQFGNGAKIVIKHAANSDVYQMWNIGNKWYHYERAANGKKTSEGTASSEDLDQYKGEIDLWCEANQRFFHPQYCAIYQ